MSFFINYRQEDSHLYRWGGGCHACLSEIDVWSAFLLEVAIERTMPNTEAKTETKTMNGIPVCVITIAAIEAPTA